MRKHFLPILFLLIISVITYSTWFFSSALLSWGDFHANFVETVKEFVTYPTIWQSGNMFGSMLVTLSFWPQLLIAGLLANLNIDSGIIGRIMYFWPIPLLNVISMYSLSYYIFKSRIAGFISAIVYGFSAGILSLVVGGIVTEGMAISLLPFLMLSFMLLLEKKNILQVLITGLLAFVISFYEFRILYLAAWILLFYLIYYLILESKITKKILAKIIGLMCLLGGLIVLLNSYWLVGILSVNAITNNSVFATNLWGQEFTNIATSITVFPYFWTGGKIAVFTFQPILFYFWLIPIIAFLGALYANRNKKVLFFMFISLLGIFLAKQSAIPFTGVYKWLFDNLPGFNAFRYGTVFGIYTQFGYSILIAAFVALLIGWGKNLIKRKIVAYGIFTVIICLFLWNTKPLITKEIGQLSVGVNVPQEYVELKEKLVKDKNYYRTLSIPYAQRFTFYNTLHPQVGFDYLPEGQRFLSPKFLGLESIRYVISPSDPIGEIYIKRPRQSFEKYINTSGLTSLKNLGEIKLWENTNYYPQIASVSDMIYVVGNENIKNIIDLPTSDRVAYYFEGNMQNDKDMLFRNKIMLDKSTKIYATASCIRCDIGRRYYDFVKIPYANFLPDFPLYFLIKQKEEKDLRSSVDLKDKIDKETLYSEKRIIELLELINNNANSQYISSTVLEYSKILSDFEFYFMNLDNAFNNNEILLKIYDYLMLEKRQIDDFLNRGTNTERFLLQNLSYRLDSDIQKLSDVIWSTKGENKRLVVSIPESGDYSVFVKNDPEVDMDNSILLIDNNIINLESLSGNFFETSNLPLSKGYHLVGFAVKPRNLLEMTSLDIQLISDTLNAGTKIPVKNLLDSEAKYKLSFEYKMDAGETPRIFISDSNNKKNDNFKSDYVLDMKLENNRDGKWHYSEVFLTPSVGIENVALNFWLPKQDSGMFSKIFINNLTLTKVVEPVINFVKDNGKKLSTPKISFQQVNPTDYQIKVENAAEDFFLSFSEGFDGNWKIYIEKDQSANKPDTKWENADVVTSYFEGEILEKEYANSADISTILKTFKQENLADYFHGRINGFGNGWVMPSGDYTAHIIYRPQRYVLIGTFITLITLVVAVGGILFLGIKEIKKRNISRN